MWETLLKDKVPGCNFTLKMAFIHYLFEDALLYTRPMI
jgi:hypothetical protein